MSTHLILCSQSPVNWQSSRSHFSPGQCCHKHTNKLLDLYVGGIPGGRILEFKGKHVSNLGSCFPQSPSKTVEPISAPGVIGFEYEKGPTSFCTLSWWSGPGAWHVNRLRVSRSEPASTQRCCIVSFLVRVPESKTKLYFFHVLYILTFPWQIQDFPFYHGNFGIRGGFPISVTGDHNGRWAKSLHTDNSQSGYLGFWFCFTCRFSPHWKGQQSTLMPGVLKMRCDLELWGSGCTTPFSFLISFLPGFPNGEKLCLYWVDVRGSLFGCILASVLCYGTCRL